MGRPTTNHTHGSTGTKPSDGTDFETGDVAPSEAFDWLFDTTPSAIDALSAEFDRLDSDDDGVVDEADSANTYKGNDIDSDGDGTVDEADSAQTIKGNDIDSDGDGAVDKADDADTVGGESPSAFADTNHGNEEHSSDFTTLSEVNNNADVPNADYADNAGDADTVDGKDASDLTYPSTTQSTSITGGYENDILTNATRAMPEEDSNGNLTTNVYTFTLDSGVESDGLRFTATESNDDNSLEYCTLEQVDVRIHGQTTTVWSGSMNMDSDGDGTETFEFNFDTFAGVYEVDLTITAGLNGGPYEADFDFDLHENVLPVHSHNL